MIEIPEPPEPRACASCNLPIAWLWPARTQRWVAFVAAEGPKYTITPHLCGPPLQDRQLWRALPHGDPPSAVYIEIKKQIASKETT